MMIFFVYFDGMVPSVSLMDADTLPAGSRQRRLGRQMRPSAEPRRGKAEEAAPVPRHCGAPLRTTINDSRHDWAALV